MKNLPTLRTARLVLRDYRVEDASTMHVCFSDPACVTYWSRGAFATEVETVAYASENATHPRFKTWAITEDGGEALGWVTLMFDDGDDFAEIGYILRRDRWGRGYVTEALAPVITYGFETFGLRAIQADIDPENVGSIRVAERAGLKFDRFEANTIETHLGLRDSVYYRISRP